MSSQNTKILAIIVAVIVVVAAIGAALVLSGSDTDTDDDSGDTSSSSSGFSSSDSSSSSSGGSSSSSSSSGSDDASGSDDTTGSDDTEDTDYGIAENETGRVLVYGNANNDDTIDEDDVKYIQAIVDGNIEWDSDAYPYADADYDGDVDSDDVAYVEDIVAGNTVTLYYVEFYQDISSHVVSVTYPMKTDSIGVFQYQGAIMLSMLGLWDNVDYADNTTIKYVGYFFADNEVESYGAYSTSGYTTTDNVEVYYNSGVDVLVINGNYTSMVVREALEAMGSETQVIITYCQGTTAIDTIATYGFLLGAEDAAAEYLGFYDDAMDYVSECMDDVTEDEYVSYYLVMNPADSSSIKIRSVNPSTGAVYPDLQWVLTLPGVNMMPYGDTSYVAYRTAEWFTLEENASDYIILSLESISSSYSDIQEATDAYAEMFVETQAYKDGKIIGLPYGTFNGLYSPAYLVLLASYLYPDHIDSEYGQELFDEFYQKFHGGSDSDYLNNYLTMAVMSSGD